MNIFEGNIKQNKISLIYPNMGVYRKVCFAYQRVSCHLWTTDLNQNKIAEILQKHRAFQN